MVVHDASWLAKEERNYPRRSSLPHESWRSATHVTDVDTRLARDSKRGSLTVQALMLESEIAIGPGTLSIPLLALPPHLMSQKPQSCQRRIPLSIAMLIESFLPLAGISPAFPRIITSIYAASACLPSTPIVGVGHGYAGIHPPHVRDYDVGCAVPPGHHAPDQYHLAPQLPAAHGEDLCPQD